jgi:serine/threonine protein kinase
MVFPYMEHDLVGLLENHEVSLTPAQIKLYAMQLLQGMEYLHAVRSNQTSVCEAELLNQSTT